jgi:hypothetical protein
MTSIGTNSAQVTLSGRELALQRRQAMALRGKVAVAKPGALPSMSGLMARPALSSPPKLQSAKSLDTAVVMPPANKVNAARQRRQALSQSGKSALGASTTVSRPVGLVRPSPAVAADCGCACKGSSDCATGVMQAPAARVDGGSTQAIDKQLSGRDVAKQRRWVRATSGRQDTSASAPSPKGRMRAKNTIIPAATHSTLMQSPPGKSAAGLAVDGPQKVTGTQEGTYKAVTGTAFLSLDQFTSITGHPTAPSPRQVSVMPPHGDQQVSVLDAGHVSKVTGNEAGALRQLTGSPCASPMDVSQPTRPAPTKVAKVQTLAGSVVTGTEVGRSSKVTGDDRGGCRAVTGTDYISAHQLRAVCEDAQSVQAVRKVGQDRTWNDHSITGARVGRSKQVTGDEYGGCAAISGTPYIGIQPYQSFCKPEQVNAQQALSRREGFISASVVTGDRPGAGGRVMTGDQRGACGPISGTPYVGVDNMPPQCGTSARFVQPERAMKDDKQSDAASDFSIRPPSRQARDRLSNAVTSSAFSGQRITGAANKGLGLITGTPEFRHRDNTPTLAPQAASGASKLTGEGSQSGVQISGAAWQISGRVTGTEGASSLARNPTQRGDARDMGMAAKNSRKPERAEQAQSKVTGSSGHTSKGACVTLSGGARG